jgi:hypothetical protein
MKYTSQLALSLLLALLSFAFQATAAAQTIYRPSSNMALGGSGFDNPANFYDNNLSTFSTKSVVVGSHNSGGGASHSWQGFPAIVGTPTLIELKIVSKAFAGAGTDINSQALVAYSTDNGITWNTVYKVNPGSRSEATDVIPLPLSTDLTALRIKAAVTAAPGSVGASCSMFEGWVEVTAN